MMLITDVFSCSPAVLWNTQYLLLSSQHTNITMYSKFHTVLFLVQQEIEFELKYQLNLLSKG